jgi:hypothetical protein
MKHATPTTVKLSDKPKGYAYHRVPGNKEVVRAVPVYFGANVRDVKKEISRAKRGRDFLGRRVRQ